MKDAFHRHAAGRSSNLSAFIATGELLRLR